MNLKDVRDNAFVDELNKLASKESDAEGRKKAITILKSVGPGAAIGAVGGYGVGFARGLTHMHHFKVGPLAHSAVGAGVGAALGGINAYETLKNEGK